MTTTAIRIDTVFERAQRTTEHDADDLKELSTVLGHTALPDTLGYFFVDDEIAVRLLCATYGGRYPRPRLHSAGLHPKRLRMFEWCALYPLPLEAFATIARKYGPGARNIIVLGTAERPTDADAGVDSALPPWQLAETTIYIGEKVLLFPIATGPAAEPPKDLTEVYLQQGLRGVLETAGYPPIEVINFNPRQRDLASQQNGRLLERLLAGVFAP